MKRRNFDVAKLVLKAVDQGFILGAGRIGVTPLGVGVNEFDLRDVMTGLDFDASSQVELGVFPHPDAVRLNLKTGQADAPENLSGMDIEFGYDGLTLFKGPVLSWQLDEEPDADQRAKYRGYTRPSGSLTATNRAERFARTMVSILGLPEQDVPSRLAAAIPFLGTVTLLDPDERLTSAWRTERFAAAPADVGMRPAKDLLREAEAILGAVAVYDATAPSVLQFRPVGGGGYWVNPDLTSRSRTAGDFVSGFTLNAMQDETIFDTVTLQTGLGAVDQQLSLDVPYADDQDVDRILNGIPLAAFGSGQPVECSTILDQSLIDQGSLVPSAVSLPNADLVSFTSYPVTSLRHQLTQWVWSIQLQLGAPQLISRNGAQSPIFVPGTAWAASIVSWDVVPDPLRVRYRINARADHYPRSPADFTVGTETVDSISPSATLALAAGTWYVSVFAIGSTGRFSYPATIDPITVP